MRKTEAPWTAETVMALFAYQRDTMNHAFTCGDRADHPLFDGDQGVLVPTVGGWICPFCSYTQNWAYASMAEAVPC